MLNIINLSNDEDKNLYSVEEAVEYLGDNDLILVPLSNEDMREYAASVNGKSLLVVWYHAFWGLFAGEMDGFREALPDKYEIEQNPYAAHEEGIEKFPIDDVFTVVRDGSFKENESRAKQV